MEDVGFMLRGFLLLVHACYTGFSSWVRFCLRKRENEITRVYTITMDVALPIDKYF